EIALEDLKEIATALSDVASIEVPPQMEGRTMLVVLAPNKSGVKKKEKGELTAEPNPSEAQPSK
ncbi:MAG: translation initiation factor IF-3, partial [Bacteroidota bacterium]